jgi:hypothetical protein
MKVSFILSGILALGCVNAVMVPIGAKDGMYMSKKNPVSGEDESTWVGPLKLPASDIKPRATAPLHRRIPGTAVCGSFGGNANDFSNAEAEMENWFGSGNSFSSSSVHWVVNGAVAYGCNYGGGQFIAGSTIAAFFGEIDGNCTRGGVGWVTIPGWKASYGRTDAGNSFC